MIANRKPLGLKLESYKEPSYLKNSVGIYVDCNEKFAALVGTSRDRICGHTDLDLPGKPSILLGRHQKDVTFFKSQLTEQNDDFYISQKAGSEWKVNRKLLFSQNDEPYLLARLNNSQQSNVVIPLWVEPFRSVYDSHPDPILMLEKAKLVYCNKAFLNLGSFDSIESVLYKGVDEIFDYSELSLANKLSELKRIYRTVRKQGIYKSENHLLSAGKTNKPIEFSIYKVDVLGRSAFAVSLKDNSQLEDKRYQMERIAKNAPVVIFRFARKNNGEFYFKYLSDRCYEVFGVLPEEILKDSQLAFTPLSEKDRIDFFSKVEDSAKNLKKFHWEGNTLSATGEKKYVHISSEPYRTDLEVVWDGVIIDKTEANHLMEALEQQENQLKSQAKLSSLGQVSASLVHEINNPISIILGFSAQAKKLLSGESWKAEKSKEQILRKVERIESMGLRISRIIGGLKKLSRDGQNDPIEGFSLKDLFAESLSLTSEAFRYHSIDLKQSEIDEGQNINGRVVEVSQVLVNLLVNASDAIEGHEKPWIRLSYCESLDDDFIYVEDSGHGIPQELIEKVMKPFFTTKEVGKGTGLGLSISKKIMESHGGDLIYDPEAPNTCFILRFPKVKAHGHLRVA